MSRENYTLSIYQDDLCLTQGHNCGALKIKLATLIMVNITDVTDDCSVSNDQQDTFN